MPILVYVVSAWIAGLFLSAMLHESGNATLAPIAMVACSAIALAALVHYWPARASHRARPTLLAVALSCAISIAIGHAHWQQRSACLSAMDAAARGAVAAGETVPFDIIIDEPVAGVPGASRARRREQGR